jgi:protein SCO1/2
MTTHAIAAATGQCRARPAPWRSLLASLCAGVAGLWVSHAATDGFQAYTLESARRLAALRNPAPLPKSLLELSDGRRIGLGQLSAPVLLVDFAYTRCEGYCSVLGTVFTRLQERLAPEIAAGQVRLVTISFDPENDDPAALAAYRARHRGDPQAWLLGRPTARAQLPRWLDAFGVVVVRDELGGYAHNAAVHVVDANRKLVAVEDAAALDATAARVRALLGRPQRDALAF